MLFQLVYYSKAVQLMQKKELLDILVAARAFNHIKQVTGILLYKDQSFMQLLEGNESAVQQIYQKIRNDKRHFNLKVLFTGHSEERFFSEWSMAFQNLDETQPDGYSNFLTDHGHTINSSFETFKDLEAMKLLHFFKSHS